MQGRNRSLGSGVRNGVHADPDRAYRRSCRAGSGERSYQVVVEETDLWIVSPEDLSADIAALVHELRAGIKGAMSMVPGFATSMIPVEVPAGAAPVVKAMTEASSRVGVGPMAAVAGAIAQAVVERFSDRTADLLVENGGDIHLHSSRDRFVGLLSDPEQGVRIGVRVRADEFPCSFCASSGRIGHSVSLGRGDLVVVRSRNASLADAAATALANMVVSPEDVNRAVNQARKWSGLGLNGVFVQCGEVLAVWGRMELDAVGS
ncbi:MAG: UPF0280 family protein [Deltaproteobacteria bacterium]|nr:UPF0280 family protein [Deltaproteobacteria bacterium]